MLQLVLIDAPIYTFCAQAPIAHITSLIKHLTTRSEALEEMVQQLTEQNRTLQTAVQDQEETINKLFAYLEKYNSCALEDSDEYSHTKNHKT